VAEEDDTTDAIFDELEERALDALAQGWTHVEAGALVGRSAKWIQRKLQNEPFRHEARLRRTAQLDSVAGQLGAIGPRAVAILQQSLESENDNLRLRAASIALSLVTRIGRQADLETRMAELERRAAHDSVDGGRR
jgi:hypothetical protein